MILIVRLAESLGEIFVRDSTLVPLNIILIMGLSFTLSELLPLTLVVYGIYLQIDWRKVQSVSIE